MKELLDVLRVQRHDFINHLQIISGMIQLNKQDRVFGYIQEIAREMTEAGKINALAQPEAAAALLIARNKAVKHGVEVHFGISSNLAGCKLGGPALADVIERLIDTAIRETCGDKCMPGEIFVDINEQGNGFMVAVSFVCRRQVFAGEPLESLEHICRGHGVRVRCGWAAEDKVQLRVELPKD